MRRLALVVFALVALPHLSGGATGVPVQRGLEYLATQLDATYPTNIVEAASGAGLDPKRWPSEGANAFERLSPYGSDETAVYNSHLRIAYAAGTAGYDPRNVNGVDHVAAIRAGFTGAQFGSPTYVNDDIWAILGLRAAGVPVWDPQLRDAVSVVRAAQRIDGGWSYLAADVTGWTDVTGMALSALAVAGLDMSEFSDARSFLDATRITSGGHASKPGGSSANCQSTAWAIHGYHALGVETEKASLDFLRSLQRADGGFGISSSASGSNAFCSAEAVLVLTGARHPMPGFEPPTIVATDARAGEPATLSVAPPFASLDVSWRDARVVGGRNFTPPAGGTYAYDYLAEGPGIRARGTGLLPVKSALPVVGAFPPSIVVHRPGELVLDLANASDPDGRIVAFEVDWGDGNLTNATRHAYATPGEFAVSVRAQDDAGEWSAPSGFRALVPNRAPEIAPIPARIVGDRLIGASFTVHASDPDGDAIEGTGPRTVRPAALGAHLVPIVVRDAFGAQARANVTVEIVNLPPRVSLRAPDDPVAGEVVELVAEASDPDGPAPTLAWSAGPRARPDACSDASGSSLRCGFDAGEHTVEVVATDADGATTSTNVTFRVREIGQSPSEAPQPAIRALDAVLQDGLLTVTFDAEGYATLLWASDAGDGERRNAQSPLAIDLAGATWASVSLEARSGASKVERILRLSDTTSEAAKTTPAILPASTIEDVVVQPSAPPAAPALDEPLAAAPILSEEPTRPTPASGVWLLVAAALLATLGRRAR